MINRATSRSITATILAGALLAALAATAQQPPPRGAGGPARGAVMGPPRAGQNDAPDTPGTGAYPAMKEEVASLPDHVVYRPANPGAMGNLKLGVVAWGNGGCSDDGASARNHLLELASHGYLVIAAGRIYSGPGAHPAPAEAKPFPRTPLTTLTEAIDWALAENARQGSPLAGRIDPRAIAVAGFSCGGLQAALTAKDPRVATLIMQNTGTYDGERATMPGLKVPKSTVKSFHTPVLYILGGPTDVAYENGMDDFRLIDHVPVAVANLPVGHGGTYNEPNGGAAAQVARAWLDWQLRGDAKGAAWFVGESCGLCKDAKWTLQKKNLPAR
jgi:dienelactone hydrolase